MVIISSINPYHWKTILPVLYAIVFLFVIISGIIIIHNNILPMNHIPVLLIIISPYPIKYWISMGYG
jgi:hypothetical protein